MKCFTCIKNISKETCGACREVLKIDLVKIVLELDPIYLSEGNRNKTGRPSKLTATERNDIKYNYYHPPENKKISMKTLADKYDVKKSTIFNIVHKK